MRVEHLRKWIRGAIWEEDPDNTHRRKVVEISQTNFCNGTLAYENTQQTVVFIPKGYRWEFRGVGLVEVLWKTIPGLLNQCFTSAIRFHDVLHGFRAGRSTGTS